MNRKIDNFEQSHLARAIAKDILAGFNHHFTAFQKITANAKTLFETRQWQQVQHDAKKRIYFYDKRVKECITQLKTNFALTPFSPDLWLDIKHQYVMLLYKNQQPELAETFYTSVFCHLSTRQYFNNHYIFIRPSLSTEHLDIDNPVIHSYFINFEGTKKTFKEILINCDFAINFTHIEKDMNCLASVLDLALADFDKKDKFEIQIIRSVFFRNKGAYVLGKIDLNGRVIPILISILHNKKQGLFVDTMLYSITDISVVFSFSRSYFMVASNIPAAIVSFIKDLLAHKSHADLYNAIGFHKQGKTMFYRDFIKCLALTNSQLIKAPGIKGMVMLVFTLPSYPYVFKLIRDKFKPPKNVSRQQVKDKYQMVKMHDRVGRLADTLEFSKVSIPLARFEETLLEELKTETCKHIEIDGDNLIIQHLYIENRMTPLNLYIQNLDKAELERIIIDYGNTIKDLIHSNIFPGDMLFKNFGVTRQKRVVFYDYDEITTMAEPNFRKIPAAQNYEDEMAAEPWYHVAPNDVFPEEFITFLSHDPKIRQIFIRHHQDLLDADYWSDVQESLVTGQISNIFPYDNSKRFCAQ